MVNAVNSIGHKYFPPLLDWIAIFESPHGNSLLVFLQRAESRARRSDLRQTTNRAAADHHRRAEATRRAYFERRSAESVFLEIGRVIFSGNWWGYFFWKLVGLFFWELMVLFFLGTDGVIFSGNWWGYFFWELVGYFFWELVGLSFLEIGGLFFLGAKWGYFLRKPATHQLPFSNFKKNVERRFCFLVLIDFFKF